MRSFRQYLEFRQAAPSFTDSLERELGIRPKDLEGKNPTWAANIKLGKYTYNGLTYEIVRWEKDASGNVSGAVIRPVDTQRAYVKTPEGMVRSPDDHEDEGKEFFVSKADIDKMMNQEAGTAPPGGGGGMPPMPGMGG